MQDGQTPNADSAEELVALQRRIRELEVKQSGREAELSGARQRFEHVLAVSPAIIYATHAYGSFRQKLKSRVEHRCDRPCSDRFSVSPRKFILIVSRTRRTRAGITRGDVVFSTIDTHDVDKTDPKMDCGTHLVTGGTGKYKGITEREPFACISKPTPAGEPEGSFAIDIPHNTTWEIKG